MTTVFSIGPVPAYNNPPIHPEYFKPKRFFISDVTLGPTTTVTTTEDNDYAIGQLVRLIIPPSSGCRQLNEMQGYVISIPAFDQVVLDIDSSRNVDPFTSSSSPTQPQILALGDINSGQINNNGRVSNKTYIPGSFQNISPQ